MRKGDFTLIIAAYGKGAAKKYTISRKLIVTLSLSALIVSAAFSISTLHYYYMWKKTGNHSELLAEVDELRRENGSFRTSARQLDDRLALLETAAKKLEIMAGFSESAVGVGGPDRGPTQPIDLSSSRKLKKQFNAMERKRFNLQTEFSKLQEQFTSRQTLLAAMPTILPANGYPSDRFGMRKDPFTGKPDWHPGLDITAPRGTRVVATADGIVRKASWNRGYGKLVTIEHRFGLSTRYGHLSKITVEPGQKVKRGDTIGYVGSTGRATGNHVHFEVRLHGDALDPLRFLH